jgi:hypothetical protein
MTFGVGNRAMLILTRNDDMADSDWQLAIALSLLEGIPNFANFRKNCYRRVSGSCMFAGQFRGHIINLLVPNNDQAALSYV